MVILPDLPLHDTHLLITRKLLTLYNLDLQEGSAGSIRAEGTAGTGEDKRIDFKFGLERLPIAEWLPSSWRKHINGEVSGKIAWRGKNPKLKNSDGEAILRLDRGSVVRLPLLEKIADLTGEKALERLTLTECSAESTWHYPKAEIRHVVVEDNEKFRAEGAITVDDKQLSGTIELGVARHLLGWLPNAEEVFSNEHDGYLWTSVHLSGTLDAPQTGLESAHHGSDQGGSGGGT